MVPEIPLEIGNCKNDMAASFNNVGRQQKRYAPPLPLNILDYNLQPNL